MKNFDAKISKAGATLLYLDGKRISEAKASALLASEVCDELTGGIKTTTDSKFVVRVFGWGYATYPDRSHGNIDFHFLVGVDTVSAGVKVATRALKIFGVQEATPVKPLKMPLFGT